MYFPKRYNSRGNDMIARVQKCPSLANIMPATK